jgi:glyoxylase I family protein
MITGIAHACFTTVNLDKSLEFYCKGLGIPIAFEFKDKNGVRFGVYLKVGRRTFLEIFRGELKPKAEWQSFGHICLEVENVQKEVEELRARGVEASDPLFGSDNSWQSWVTDPDGNRIELHAYNKDSWQTPHLK